MSVTSISRRIFLRGTLAGGVIATIVGTGMLRPARVLAASWPQDAFGAESIDIALKSVYGTSATAQSEAVKLKAPIQAENGAVVPITISATLPDVEAIGILVDKNPRPLVATVDLPAAAAYFSARIKMAETSGVRAVVKAGGKLYMSEKEIKVTVGGCGG